MKISIFTNHFYPEDFKVNDIAFELSKRGYEVTVITAIPDYPKGSFYEGYSLFKRRKEIINGVTVIRLPIIPRRNGNHFNLAMNYISYYVSLLFFTFSHSLRNKYDRIFVHLTSPFFVGIFAMKMSKWQKIPLLFWVLDLWPESLISAGGIKNKYIINSQIRMVNKVYSQCTKILIGSKGFEKSICEKGDFKNKIVYFPNWAEEIKGECPLNFDINAITPFNEQDNFIILFAGNIGEAQNLDAVIESSKFLNNERIKFVFIGDGRRRSYLQELVNKYNLNKTVYLLDRYPLQTMPVFMNRASILLFSLKDESCFNLTVPAKVQFYMSQGKPILAMINGDGADLVQEANCGFTVPAGDSEKLAEVIKKVSTMDKQALEVLGENGKSYYQNHFTKEQRMESLDLLLKECNDE